MNNDFQNLYFKLAFQKIINVNDSSIYKYEVLSRFYNTISHDHYNPETILSYLTTNNLLNDFTMSQLSLLKRMARKGVNYNALSINIEPSQLSSLPLIYAIIDLQQVVGTKISIEVTEREDFILNGPQISMISLLNSEGINICLDDFGVGGSGFLRLVELPVSEIKLDKCLVNRILNCDKSMAVLRSISTLCKQLDIILVAEGVESLSIATTLKKLNILYQQGYYYGKAQEFFSCPNNKVITH